MARSTIDFGIDLGTNNSAIAVPHRPRPTASTRASCAREKRACAGGGVSSSISAGP